MSDKMEEAKNAINKVFGDMDATKSETIENLRELIDDIEVMIETLEED